MQSHLRSAEPRRPRFLAPFPNRDSRDSLGYFRWRRGYFLVSGSLRVKVMLSPRLRWLVAISSN